MSVILSKELPSYLSLKKQGYPVLAKEDECLPDIRIGLLNLMPDKKTTENHFAQVLSHTLASVEPVFLSLETHQPTHTPKSHMSRFYTQWQKIDLHLLNGMIITGAPVEHLAYENISYWQEICDLFRQIKKHQLPTLFICWSAQAALYYYYQIDKHVLKHKCLGLFPHKIKKQDPLVCGFDDRFDVPVARHTEIRKDQLEKCKQVEIISDSELSGVYITKDNTFPAYYIFNHLEYTSDTIIEEYFREIKNGKKTPLPYNYFPNKDIHSIPQNRWRAHASLFYSNWIQLCTETIRCKSKKTLNLALIGANSTAIHLLRILHQNQTLIEERTGYHIQITGISSDCNKYSHQYNIYGKTDWYEDPLILAHQKKTDIIILLKSQQQKTLAFEAAIGGAIPILKTLRETLSSDRVSEIIAVLNGESNSVLYEMESKHIDFKPACENIKNYGIINTNRSNLETNLDIVCKLNLLSCVAFGKNTFINQIPQKGIETVRLQDIQLAKDLGYRIRLLAIAKKQDEIFNCFVHPYLIGQSNPLACITRNGNGILCLGQNTGELFLTGQDIDGAATASAIISDILDIACNRKSFAFSVPAKSIKTVPLSKSFSFHQYYIRTETLKDIPFSYTVKEKKKNDYILISEPLSNIMIDRYYQSEQFSMCLPIYQ